jgi:hypothetical protein
MIASRHCSGSCGLLARTWWCILFGTKGCIEAVYIIPKVAEEKVLYQFLLECQRSLRFQVSLKFVHTHLFYRLRRWRNVRIDYLERSLQIFEILVVILVVVRWNVFEKGNVITI